MKVVLRLLKPSDQIERVRAVLHAQGQHLEARLAALQGVAALVRQPGNHLSDGGQPFRPQRPFLRLLDESDIVADAENGRAIVIVGQIASVPDDPAARAVTADDGILESAVGSTGDHA